MVTEQNYKIDEFDKLAAERTIMGAHRVRPRANGWLIALVSVLILTPVLGLLFGIWVSSGDNGTAIVSKIQSVQSNSDSPSSSTDSNSSSDTNSDTSTDVNTDGTDTSASTTDGSSSTSDSTDASTDANTDAQAETPQADTAANVRVLNGAGINGLAAEKAKVLTDAGYTAVQADNYNYRSPQVSTVYYASAEDEVTARDVATKLGVSTVTLDASAVNSPARIVVVLRSR